MKDETVGFRISALAAGELDAVEAQHLRTRLAEDPELARRYGEILAVRRALADFVAGPFPARPGLDERILAVTLPRCRALPARRRNYWPTWLAAAAAAAAFVFVFEPPPLAWASHEVGRLRANVARTTDRAVAELGVLRASLSLALEDRLDRLGDRLRDLEQATRRRDGRAEAPAQEAETTP